MNTITFSMCQKPVIGMIMWLTSMCATNQALHDTYLNINKPNDATIQNITIPMDEVYTFRILLSIADIKEKIQGHRVDPICSIASDNTKSSLTLAVDLLTENEENVGHFELSPTCPHPKWQDDSSIVVGSIPIKKGKYKIQITNRNSIVLKEGHVQVLLMGQSTGFP
jgi:hypothetical protein